VRVGLLIYGSLETISGGYLYDRKLVEHLLKRGDEVELVSLPWRNYARHLGDNLSREWRSRLEKLKIDVLLQDELNHPSLAWANRQIRDQVSYPIVSIVHHLRSSEEHPGWIRPLYRQIERAYLQSVDACIFNSQTTRQAVEQVVGHPAPGIVATPAGDRFTGQVSAVDVSRRAVREGPLAALFVGNLIPRKNVGLVIRALARLRKTNWELNVVGSLTADPSYSQQMQRLADRSGIRKRVHFLGPLDDADLAHQFLENHLLAVPSSYEGFGIVYLEGFQHGLPALGSSRGAARELIAPGETGWLVDPGQVEEAARCLEAAALDRAMLARMGVAALERSRFYPTWEQTGERIRNFLYSGVQWGKFSSWR